MKNLIRNLSLLAGFATFGAQLASCHAGSEPESLLQVKVDTLGQAKARIAQKRLEDLKEKYKDDFATIQKAVDSIIMEVSSDDWKEFEGQHFEHPLAAAAENWEQFGIARHFAEDKRDIVRDEEHEIQIFLSKNKMVLGFEKKHPHAYLDVDQNYISKDEDIILEGMAKSLSFELTELEGEKRTTVFSYNYQPVRPQPAE